MLARESRCISVSVPSERRGGAAGTMKRTENLLFVVSRYLHGHEKALITAVLCSLVTGACVAFQPLIIKYVVDDGISNDALGPQRKLLVVGGLCAIYILVSLIRVRSYRLGYRIARAKELLHAGATLAQAAEQTGFQTAASLSRALHSVKQNRLKQNLSYKGIAK